MQNHPLPRLDEDSEIRTPGATGFASALPDDSQTADQEKMLAAIFASEYAVEHEAVSTAQKEGQV